MMGVSSVEVYDTVNNLSPIDDKLKVLLTDEQLKKLGFGSQSVLNVEHLYEITDT